MNILRAFRITFFCGLFVFHAVLLTLNGLVLGSGKVSPLEAFLCATDIIAIFMIATTAVYELTHRNHEPVNTPNIIAFGSVLLITVSGSIASTIRANALCQDSSHLISGDSDCTLGTIIIALSWITTIIALVGVLIAMYDKHPGAIKLVPRYSGGALPARAPSKSARDMRRLRAAPKASASAFSSSKNKGWGVNNSTKAQSGPLEHNPESDWYGVSGWFDEEEDKRTIKYPPRVKKAAPSKSTHQLSKSKAPSERYATGQRAEQQLRSEWF